MKKKVFELALGNWVYAGLSGLLSIYVARELGPSERGILAILIGTTLLAASILNFGISHASAYYIRVVPGAAGTIIKYINRNIVASILIMLLFLYTARSWFATLFLSASEITDVMLVIITANTAANTANLGLGATLVAVGESRLYSFSLNVGICFACFITVVTFFVFGPSIEIAMVGTTLGQVLTNIMFRKNLRKISAQANEPLASGSFLGFGLKAYITSISALVFKRLDLFIIGLFINNAGVGHYAVGLSLRELALILPRAVAGLIGGEVAGRRLSKDAISGSTPLLRKSVMVALGTSIPIAILSFITFPFLIPLLFGDAYEPSITPAWIMMISLVPMSCAIVISTYILNLGKPSFTSVAFVISGVITVAALIFLTENYGLNGAASALIVGALILLSCMIGAYVLLVYRREQVADSQSSKISSLKNPTPIIPESND